MSFIKTNRDSVVFEFLAKNRHSALVLLLLIAKRAKRTEYHPDKRLEIGEAYIGDYETYGVTKQIYRTDKALLKSTGQITLRTTNKGTIARLVRTDLFDINSLELTPKLTPGLTQQQHTTNTPATPNKKIRRQKKENTEESLRTKEPVKNKEPKSPSLYKPLVIQFNRKFGTNLFPTFGKQVSAIKRILQSYTEADIWACADWLSTDPFWKAKGFDFSTIQSQISKYKMTSQRKEDTHGYVNAKNVDATNF